MNNTNVSISAGVIRNGKFTYDTYVDGRHIDITLDLNHYEIRRMICGALSNKSRKSVEAGGALVVKVVTP